INRFSIKSVDFAENLGFDIDGDGDHSGFDQFRPTFEEILAKDETDSNWKLIDKKTGELIDAPGVETKEVSHSLVAPWDAANLRNEDGFRILPAKNVLACLGIAIGGHAFWNGTLVSVEKLGEVLGLGLGGFFILNMAWVSILIVVLLILARGIFKG
ncbi:MAG: hypothetical protein VW438_03750, partial [Euryarchaeota archaeon]